MYDEERVGKKRRQRRCRICKKRPVWTGGDVKNPGPVCKRCYHRHVWPERMERQNQGARGAEIPEADEGDDVDEAWF